MLGEGFRILSFSIWLRYAFETCLLVASSTSRRVIFRSVRMEARYCPSVGFTLLLWVAGRTVVRLKHRVSGSRSVAAKDYTLRVKFAGERPRKVGLDEKIDLRRPGVEKFKALPRDQTEG